MSAGVRDWSSLWPILLIMYALGLAYMVIEFDIALDDYYIKYKGKPRLCQVAADAFGYDEEALREMGWMEEFTGELMKQAQRGDGPYPDPEEIPSLIERYGTEPNYRENWGDRNLEALSRLIEDSAYRFKRRKIYPNIVIKALP